MQDTFSNFWTPLVTGTKRSHTKVKNVNVSQHASIYKYIHLYADKYIYLYTSVSIDVYSTSASPCLSTTSVTIHIV